MAGRCGGSRVGVCIVRVVTDASAGLIITVTACHDLNESRRESVVHTTATQTALARVAEFLAEF